MSLELSPHLGLICPVCNRSIPEIRLQAPWCDCGWRRHRSKLPWIAAAVLAVTGVAVWAFLIRSPRPASTDEHVASVTSTGNGSVAVASHSDSGPRSEHIQSLTALPSNGQPAIASVESGPDQLLTLARKLVAEGRLKQAEEVYRKLVRGSPRLLEARLELGLLCGDLQNFDCAVSELEEARKLRPNNAEVLEALASILRDAGRIEPAVDAYRGLIRMDRLNPRPALELARTLDRAGRRDDAVVAYQDFLNRFPDAPEAAEARRRFEDLTRPEGSPNPKRSTSVPIRRSGAAILVTGEVEDSKDVRFLLDTGSTFTVISSELAEELGFNLRDPNLRKVRLDTANGPVEAPLVTVETVRIGKAVARNVKAAVYDIGTSDRIDGLLGLSFLDRFRFTIDSGGKVMHLEPR